MNVISKDDLAYRTSTKHHARLSSTQSLSQISLNLPAFFQHARLPRIKIPKFNGSPADWLSFKDLFTSLVLDNPTLT